MKALMIEVGASAGVQGEGQRSGVVSGWGKGFQAQRSAESDADPLHQDQNILVFAGFGEDDQGLLGIPSFNPHIESKRAVVCTQTQIRAKNHQFTAEALV